MSGLIEHQGWLYLRQGMKIAVPQDVLDDAARITGGFAEVAGLNLSGAFLWDVVCVRGLLRAGDTERAKLHLQAVVNRVQARLYEPNLPLQYEGPTVTPLDGDVPCGGPDLEAWRTPSLSSDYFWNVVLIHQMLEGGDYYGALVAADQMVREVTA